MELVRAALDPAAGQARTRQESPVCQVVIRAAETDLKNGGLDNVNRLAIGTGVAAAGLTAWLAQERNLQPATILVEMEQVPAEVGSVSAPVLNMLKSLLTGPPGMKQTADFMARLFHDDEEAFYDLIVDLGAYVAVCVNMLNASHISSTEKTLHDLDDMLDSFFTG
ncbi:hypothetical protein ACWGJX_34460 [Streptomyces sp. NPDC054775]